ncbi:hypothetical protein PR048_031320 [Dryococelus australis]|uniref:Uncharacterized protein n=1 Tax=Dryococelus australis TaxID=614101 RepID=A0ABQ9G4W8_9NEOP|nr:hypothetical protein PR048_031320 [Dryococelus australis]
MLDRVNSAGRIQLARVIAQHARTHAPPHAPGFWLITVTDASKTACPDSSSLVPRASEVCKDASTPRIATPSSPLSLPPYVRLHRRGSQLDQKAVAPFEFRAGLEIEMMFISNRQSSAAIGDKCKQNGSVAGKIQSHNISDALGETHFNTVRRFRAAVAERLASHQDEPGSIPGRVTPRIFACGDHAGRCLWWAGFLGDLPFPPPFHSGAAPRSHQPHSSAYNTSMLTHSDPVYTIVYITHRWTHMPRHGSKRGGRGESTFNECGKKRRLLISHLSDAAGRAAYRRAPSIAHTRALPLTTADGCDVTLEQRRAPPGTTCLPRVALAFWPPPHHAPTTPLPHTPTPLSLQATRWRQQPTLPTPQLECNLHFSHPL